ncbi:(Fe-S)-binding protein [Desulfonema magnum]|uniref:4Fe-4S ferredoxin iron-sulfur binding domain-containing protein, cysteine-rich domain-containing n=1 Tax=Desulfonema magnum TaxID=45655 RepID=A0A975GMP4_9BACT|nr:(Fe-S)-binding protein [Desulfonema magnum]QTA87131.1 4Fe-4S ferredoxin iron-sulfur binding domain-containing protein, cysteine-rich domain-containing [Desulfonema magnum]
MANESDVRYYKPKAEFSLDITDIQNFVYDMSRCIKCKGCTWVDHTYMPGAKFMTRCPSAEKYQFDSYGAYGKMRIGHAFGEGVLDWNEKALEIIYACTLCGACDVGCKRNLDLEIELSLESLRVKAVQDGVGPMPAHKKTAENIAKNHNTYAAPHDKRKDWIADVKPADKAEVLYFVGCAASYTNKEIAQSVAKIFKAANVDFMLMPDEWCCGNTVFSVGMIDEAKALAQRNVDEMRKTGAKVLVTACAEGYRMWKVDYPKLLNISTDELGFKVLHLTEYADQLIKDGALNMNKAMNTRMTYHDACSLSRLSEPWTPYEGKRQWMGCVEPRLERRRGTNGVYEPPRDILKAVPGVNYVELPRMKENAFCCGAGRGTREAFPDLATFSAEHRLEEIKHVGVETLVTACPHCKNNFAQAIKAHGDDVQVMDIAEAICASIES